jgi:hypothetical protein
MACQSYAEYHDGRFPVALSELVPSNIISREALNDYRCVIKEAHGIQADWLYFGAGFTERNPPQILIASPLSIGIFWEKPMRVVNYADGSTRRSQVSTRAGRDGPADANSGRCGSASRRPFY